MERDRALQRLSKNARAFCVPHECARLPAPPAPLDFYRDYVAANVPVVIENAFSHWPAMEKWSDEYLARELGERQISVEVTPNGRGDSVTPTKDGLMFVMPESQRMTFSEYLRRSKLCEPNPVYYISHQNNSLREDEEFGGLLTGDVEAEMPFASQAFGCAPDAVNFWMGGSKSVTSLHKDHYENTYCVVAGEKTFILYPPSDLPWLYEREYPAAQYQQRDDGAFDIVPLGSSRPWVSIDPLLPSPEFPLLSRATPLTVTVRRGEMLYLPSLWYHHVSQAERTIAVNMWYDMRFDVRYCYYRLLADLVGAPTEAESDAEESEDM